MKEIQYSCGHLWTYKRNWNYEVSYRDLVGNEEKTMNLKVPYDSDAIRVASEIAGIDFDYGEYADVMANYLQIVNCGDNGNYIHYVRNTDKNYYVFMDEPSIRKGVKHAPDQVERTANERKTFEEIIIKKEE